jgi:hypothetical protein
MNKEEAKQFYESSERPDLLFDSYYKYEFAFVGENDVMKLSVSYGGDSSDIYRFDVDRGFKKSPATFDELMDTYYSVFIKDKKSEQEFSDNHY